ncbi:MAG TPA: FAD:protein FMN transferase [Longimicrobiales bacterium]|nr:FAD:protein FMN transferase [Longimicrobiales bacterium]
MSTPEANEAGRSSRRRFLALGLGAFVVGTLPRALSPHRRLVRRTVPVMGTLAEIAVVGDDVNAAETAIDAALEELYRVERTMTRFSRNSEIGQANLLAARHAVPLGAETALVVAEAVRWSEGSGGAFDPCLGEASELWDVSHRREPPAPGDVRRFAGRSLYRHLELDRAGGACRVHFSSAAIALDLGGIAKGYAVDRAVDALRARGVRDGIVNVGGDLYALGKSERGDDWEVGIQSPKSPRELIGTLAVSDGAVATSGDYIRYFDYHGRRYHHLLDPATGEPRLTPVHSVTVAAPTCMTADVAATAVYGQSEADAGRVLGRVAPGARLVRLA